ncbi:hypothetical protein AHAS_Ahas04G0140900 [Arachis hypogaea]
MVTTTILVSSLCVLLFLELSFSSKLAGGGQGSSATATQRRRLPLAHPPSPFLALVNAVSTTEW